MSKDEEAGCLGPLLIIVLVVLSLYVIDQQVNYIRDLQRRVGQLEQQRKETTRR